MYNRLIKPRLLMIIALLCPFNAWAQVPLDWLADKAKVSRKFPVFSVQRLGYMSFELVGTGVTVCGEVLEGPKGKLFITSDSRYDRAYFEVAPGTRRIKINEGQACFIGYVRHKEGKSKEEAAKEPAIPPDTINYRYWLTR